MSTELICFLVIVGIAVWALMARKFFDWTDRKSRTITKEEALIYITRTLAEKDGDE